jgi:hypothetical protein
MKIDFTNNGISDRRHSIAYPFAHPRMFRILSKCNRRFFLEGFRFNARVFRLSGVYAFWLSQKEIDNDSYFNYRFEVWVKGVVLCEKDSKFYRA